MLLHPEDISFSSFFIDNIVAIIEFTTASAIALALWASGKPELAAMSVIAVALGDMLFNFTKVFDKLVSIGAAEGAATGPYTPIAILLFAPILILMIVTLVEWWRGVTS